MKKFCCFVIGVGLSLLLTSCTQESEKVESPSEPVIQSPLIVSHNNQEFEIINYYQEMLDYITLAKNQPENMEELYKQMVTDAFRPHGFGYEVGNHWLFAPPKDIGELEKAVHSLIDKQDRIAELVTEVLKESADVLPGGNKKVHILPDTYPMEEMGNVSGVAWNKNSFVIFINSTFLESALKHTVAHEYHHVVAMESNWAYTLLERAVIEGKADTFAKIIYPDADVPWLEPLTGFAKEEGWRVFMDNLDSTDTSLINGFYQGIKRKGIAPWTNYKIGYEIMGSFLEGNPDVTLEEWTHMNAEDVLMKSEYKEVRNQ